MVRRPSIRPTRRNSLLPLGESMFDMFEGYQEDWPGVYVPPELARREIHLVREMKRREKYTPDFSKLRHQKNILVFVYDEFKTRGDKSLHLATSKYLGMATSASDLYTLKGARFPVLLDNNKKSDKFRGRIRGEVYSVSPDILQKIDQLKYNGNLFKRQQRNFFLTEQSYKSKDGTRIPSVRAWCYIGNPDTWHDVSCSPMFSHAGSKDRKYFEYFPTSSHPGH